MNFRNYLLDAIEIVIDWDLPDESLAEAVKVQASAMARVNPDESWELCSN